MTRKEYLQQLLEKNKSILRFNPSLYRSMSESLQKELDLIDDLISTIYLLSDKYVEDEIVIAQTVLDELLKNQNNRHERENINSDKEE